MNNPSIDIILTSPPYSLKEDFGLLDFVGHYGPPINLLHLGSSLKIANITTKLIDFSNDSRSLDELAGYIVSLKPKYVGVALHFTFLAPKSFELIHLIKKYNPNIIIIVGGVHFPALPLESMNNCPGIDVGILGEAEDAIVSVLRCLKEKKDLNSLNGVVFRSNGKIIKKGNNNLVADINKLPYPDFDIIEDISSYSPALYKNKKNVTLLITTSRGCPFSCSFCDRSVLGKKIRFYNIDYLSGMIDFLHKQFNVNCLDVEDENICINKSRFKEICELFKEKYIKYNMTWSCGMRSDSVDSDTGRMLYESGCRSVFFGIESGSQKMLDGYNKKLDISNILKECRIIRSTGITLSGSFIIGGPGEDVHTMQETINLIKKIPLDYMFLHYFAPYPGTPVFNYIDSTGRIEGDYHNRTGHHISYIPKTSTKKQLEEGYKRYYRAFYTKPSVIIRTIKKTKISQAPTFIKNSIKYSSRFIFNG